MAIPLPAAYIQIAKEGGLNWWPWLAKNSLDTIDGHPWISAIAGLAPFALGLAAIFIRTGAERWKEREIDEDALALIVTSMNQIVGWKADRFGEAAKEIETNSPKKDARLVFQAITQPEEQTKRLLEALYHVLLKEVADPRSLLVTLAEINKDNVIKRFVDHFPRDKNPRTSIQSLRLPHSAISTAVRTKEMLIVPDVRKELRKPISERTFAEGNQERSNKGSIICFPIWHPQLDRVPYVISVKSDRSGEFDLVKWQKYKNLLEPFAKRLELEYSLRVLKENTTEHEYENSPSNRIDRTGRDVPAAPRRKQKAKNRVRAIPKGSQQRSLTVSKGES